jgi:hypothetical protein
MVARSCSGHRKANKERVSSTLECEAFVPDSSPLHISRWAWAWLLVHDIAASYLDGITLAQGFVVVAGHHQLQDCRCEDLV